MSCNILGQVYLSRIVKILFTLLLVHYKTNSSFFDSRSRIFLSKGISILLKIITKLAYCFHKGFVKCFQRLVRYFIHSIKQLISKSLCFGFAIRNI